VSVVVTGLLAACGADAPRGPAVERNLAALETIRPPGSARAVRTGTRGDHAPDTGEGPIVGWTTIRDFNLGRPVRSAALISQLDRRLEKAGWRLGTGGGFWRNARRGSSCVHVLASPVRLTSEEPPTSTAVASAAPPVPDEDPGDELARGVSFIVTDC
jgi:hypothetical protein